jgi:hypothetical protein
MKVLFACLSILSGSVCILTIASPTPAALPDRETYDFVTSRYTLLLEQTRSGCGYYANPDTLYVKGNDRGLLVLLMRGNPGGSLCNGVFEFKNLEVRCKTGEIAYIDRIGSPANWKEEWYSNPGVAKQVCALQPSI